MYLVMYKFERFKDYFAFCGVCQKYLEDELISSYLNDSCDTVVVKCGSISQKKLEDFCTKREIAFRPILL